MIPGTGQMGGGEEGVRGGGNSQVDMECLGGYRLYDWLMAANR